MVSKKYSPFAQNVIKVIQSVPYGKVVSYGQVAAYVGSPRAARQVGGLLQKMEGMAFSVPWWRVINNTGKITIKGHSYIDKALQKRLLEEEGIEINEDFTLAIKRYRFKANEKQLQEWGLGKEYRTQVLEKYGI